MARRPTQRLSVDLAAQHPVGHATHRTSLRVIKGLEKWCLEMGFYLPQTITPLGTVGAVSFAAADVTPDEEHRAARQLCYELQDLILRLENKPSKRQQDKDRIAGLHRERELIEQHLGKPISKETMQRHITAFIDKALAQEPDLSHTALVARTLKHLRKKLNGYYDGRVARDIVEHEVDCRIGEGARLFFQ